jgi:4-hydroxy-tetrahydrodipicolinate synthase
MLRGVYTAMITPFNKDESIDFGALRELVDFQIDQGVDGLVPMGTTGESPTVTHDENIEVIRVVIEQTAGRVPVIAGTGSNSTAEAIHMTKRAKELGANASLQVAPYYNKPNQEGMYRHFTRIAEETELPVVVYNIPGRTGQNIEPETMLRLAENNLIVGDKEASGSVPQMMDLIGRRPSGFSIVSGDDNLALALTLLGGEGVISVASNLAPGRIVRMIRAALSGDVDTARQEHYELLPFFHALLKLDTNPIPIKYAMAKAKRCEEVYRLPLWPVAKDAQKKLDGILKQTGLV